MTVIRTTTAAAGIAALAVAAGAGIAVAAPGAGVISGPAAIGTFESRVHARADRVKVSAPAGTNVAAATLTYEVGGFSGWHEHPGVVIAVVEQGAVVRLAGCRSGTFTAGESFTEVGPHFVRNLYTDPAAPGATAAVLRVTHLYPSSAPARRIEVDPPRCRH